MVRSPRWSRGTRSHRGTAYPESECEPAGEEAVGTACSELTLNGRLLTTVQDAGVELAEGLDGRPLRSVDNSVLPYFGLPRTLTD